MTDLVGTTLTHQERQLCAHSQLGGIILFARNFASCEQLAELVAEIHARRDPPLLVAVDQEGGRVQRFTTGFTRLPALAKLGNAYNRDRSQARDLTYTAGWLMAAELRAVGVDCSFAPVLDLASGHSAVIGDRAFHQDPAVVAELAREYMRGMRAAGMQAIGKHFPGHGGVGGDSHTELPVDERPLEDLMRADIIPFARMITNGLAGIMPAHVVYSRCASEPTGYSAYWLNGVLRERLRFEGAIISDDLSMAGAAGPGAPGLRARAALRAGCDMALVCNHPAGAVEVLEALEGRDNAASHQRLAWLSGHGQGGHEALRQTEQWRTAVERLDLLNAS